MCVTDPKEVFMQVGGFRRETEASTSYFSLCSRMVIGTFDALPSRVEI